MKNYEDPLAQNALNIVKEINFGENRTVKPLTDASVVKDLEKSGLNLDYRSTTESTPENKTVFEGLAFDKNAIRTQSFAVYENDQAVAIMTIAISPKNWIEKQRYLKLNIKNNTVEILDFKGITGEENLPDFVISPAWTKVIESHKNKLALPGYKAIKNIFEMLEKEAPENTSIEAIAQGQLLGEKQKEVENFFNEKELGSEINASELPFPLEMIGQNSEGSSSTVKMARLFGLDKVENAGCVTSLGPVFIKKIS